MAVTNILILTVLIYCQTHMISATCDNTMNQFDPYNDGTCHAGTKLDVSLGCCIGCPECAPGWMQSPGCKGPCIQCSDNHFSSDLQNNEVCHKCTDCATLNRQTSQACVKIKNTICGECLDGHFAHPDAPDKTLKCLPCSFYEQQCQAMEGNKTSEFPGEDEIKSLGDPGTTTNVLPIILALIGGLIVGSGITLAVFIIRERRRKQKKGSEFSPNAHPDLRGSQVGDRFKEDAIQGNVSEAVMHQNESSMPDKKKDRKKDFPNKPGTTDEQTPLNGSNHMNPDESSQDDTNRNGSLEK